jgi:hypothetical protein
MTKPMIALKSVYLTGNGEPVFDGDPRARFLLARKGSPVNRDDLLRYMSEVQADEVAPLPVESMFFMGLDLGELSDYSALAVLERRGDWREGVCHISYLRRWPLHTPYEKVVQSVVEKMTKSPPSTFLLVDSTGVGRPVVERIWSHPAMRGRVEMVRAITITSGNAETFSGHEIHVAKTALISATQILHQNKRLKINEAVDEARTLERELRSFRSKINRAAHLIFEAWRASDHDDLVLATGMAAWAASHERFDPEPIRLLNLGPDYEMETSF